MRFGLLMLKYAYGATILLNPTKKLVVGMAIFNALVNNKLTRYSFASSQKNDCIKMVVGRGPAEFHF